MYVNDRFFTHHNIGFNALGHTEVPVQSISNLKNEREVINDDLGSHKYIGNQFRVEFFNIPGLRLLDLKAMWYLDVLYYPQEKYERGGFIQSLIDFTRISHGVGINYAISPLLSLTLYFNIGNFNARKGDDALVSCLSLSFMLL